MNRNTPSRGFKSPFLGINRKSALNVKQGGNNDVPEKSSKELVRSTSRILKLFDKSSATASASTDETSVDEDTASSSSTEVTNIKENIPCTKVNGDKIIFNVVYGKKSAKKHKTWEGDGSLEVTGKAAVLKDMEGAIIGRTTVNPINLTEGARIFMSNKEIEIIEAVTDIDRTTDDLQKKKIVEPPLKRPRTEVSRRYTPVISSGLKLDYKPLVMPRPSAEVQWAAEEAKDPQEVSVDPCLAMVLRPHQRYGIAFLYQCVMGMKKPDCYGAILADEMGLGKTLQCVALIWTLLKKGPYGKPVLKHVLVIAPSSLCENWKKEFIRWLGRHRISPFVVDAKKKPGDFARLVRTPVMIVSYEMFVRCYEDINAIEFDLLICDEGHRLKNSAVKASKLLVQMNCKRRILLTGTPVQNDLREFYTLVDLVNPGVLDCDKSYKARYEDPILASRCPNASEDVLSLGEERARELNEYTKFFILRRTHETLKEYLPTKHEVVVFCRLSLQQEKLYTLITDQWFDGTIHSKGTVSPLTIITVLKKICNHVSLVKNDMSDLVQKLDPNVINCLSNRTSRGYSGKLTAVQALLTSLKKSSEKLVLVSYFTRTLDLLEGLCEAENLTHLRLDGNTPTALRMNTVEKFNANNDQFRVFLLSAKAGGTGLNLSGASRLVLFDSDWNPASDAQAMARIWRDGQKKSVYIYRFITSGTIEEKIFQRQISKTGLSEAVVSPNNASLTKLTINELKDLFTLNRDTSCLTHDLMKCPCTGRGDTGNEKEEERDAQESRDSQFTLKDEQNQQYLTINQLLHWQHYGQPLSCDFLQELMLSEVSEHINFVIKNA